MNAPNPPSHRYRVAATHGGQGVNQYDFVRHGLDTAQARLAPPNIRLSLALFSPAHHWQHRGMILNSHRYIEIDLGPLRMDYSVFVSTAQRIFEPLGIAGDALKLKSIRSGHAVRVELPALLYADKAEAIDAAYWQAVRDQQAKKDPSPSR
jgi:hypothetical protein